MFPECMAKYLKEFIGIILLASNMAKYVQLSSSPLHIFNHLVSEAARSAQAGPVLPSPPLFSKKKVV
jgi:hypothetical protein